MIEKNTPRIELRKRVFNGVGLAAAAFALASCSSGHNSASERTTTTPLTADTKVSVPVNQQEKDCADTRIIGVAGGRTTHESPDLVIKLNSKNLLYITDDPTQKRIDILQTTQIETSASNNELDSFYDSINQHPYKLDLDPSKHTQDAVLHVERDTETQTDNYSAIVCGPR